MSEEKTVEVDADEIREMYEELKEVFEDKVYGEYDLEPIQLDEEARTDILGSQEALEGLEVGSFYAGMFVTLYNVGVPVSDAVEIIQNEQNARNNLAIQKINLEIAKIKGIQIEKTEL